MKRLTTRCRLCVVIACAAGIFSFFCAPLHAENNTGQNNWYWFMQPKADAVKDSTVVNTQSDDKSNSDTNAQPVIISGHTISAPAAVIQMPNPTVNTESITTSADDSKTNYVPNEIIVKFKAEAASTLEQETTDNGKSLSSSTLASLPASLGNLARKHKVKKIAPIFKNFKKDKQKLETLQLKNNIKSKYKVKSIRISTKEAHILKRLKRAPKDAKTPDLDRIYKIELGKGQSVEEAVAEYSKDPNVEYAEPNHIYQVCATPLPDLPYIPNDYYIEDSANPGYWREGSWGQWQWGQTYLDMWGLEKIQAIEAWNLFDTNGNGIFDPGEIKPGEGAIVAVVDTGVDYNHEDLAANIWVNIDEIPGNGIDDDGNGKIDDTRGWDFAYGDNDPVDDHGHGTHCSGTIAAIGNNTVGIIGVAPHAKIMAVKGLDDSGSGDDLVLANAVRYAADNGADILSNSWGGLGYSQILTDAFYYAYSSGCIAIAAAGNDNIDVFNISPASIDTVIAVSAINQNDRKCEFSNFGDKIDLAAPGGNSSSADGPDGPSTWKLGRNILSLRAAGTDMYAADDASHGLPPGICLVPQFDAYAKYYRSRGTSMACPHVAGVAALLLSKDSTLSNYRMRDILQQSSDDIGEAGKDIYFGCGRLNAYNALINIGQQVFISISYPSFYDAQSVFRGSINVLGTAAMGDRFQRYELCCVSKVSQYTTFIADSFAPVTNGLLGTWDTTQFADGIYSLILRVVDTDNRIIATRSVDVVIDNVNDPPAFIGLTDKIIPLEQLSSFEVAATDPDDPLGPNAQLTYSASNLPPNAQFNPQTRVFSWQPSLADKGIYEVTFTVRDNVHAVSQKIMLRTVSIDISTVTVSSGFLYGLDIWGDKVVWFDAWWGGSNIYMYDITTGQKVQITNGGSCSNPQVWNDRIVYEYGETAENRDIYLYNITTGQTRRITYDPKNQQCPGIYGDTIVWYDDRNGYWEVYMYDLITNQETRLTHQTEYVAATYSYGPDIYENKIVWQDGSRSGDDWDIYMYDISTGQTTLIADNRNNQERPRIYKDKIVWEDARNGLLDIYMRDLSTGEETRITRNGNTQDDAHIYEDKIVWSDSRNGNDDVYAYDIPTKQEFRITTSSAGERSAAIYGNRIVWQAQNGIFMATLTFEELQLEPIGNKTVNAGDTLDFAVSVNYSGLEDLVYNVYQCGDLNHDGICRTEEDLPLLTLALQSKRGDANYNPEADMDNNGYIEGGDLSYFAACLGRTLPSGIILDSATGEFVWAPVPDQTGEYFVTFTASSHGLKTAQTIRIKVDPMTIRPGDSIQAAIDSIPGGLIRIEAGTYEGDISVNAKNVRLAGQIPEYTVIKGNISFVDSVSSIENMSIEYGEGDALVYSDDYYTDFRLLKDAGITAINSGITVKNCVIRPDPDIFGTDNFGKGIQIWNLYGNPAITPIIENCEISNADTGIYLYSQVFGGAILGEIKNNTLDNNNYGITLRMHREKPLIQDNTITNSINGIHITYEDGTLLTERLNNIINNTFSGNIDDIWCDELGE